MRAAFCAFRAVSFLLTCCAATLAVAAAAYRPIAVSGTAGVNVGLGPNIANASFISLDATLSGPTINATGQVAFAGKMLGVTEDIDTGIWSGAAGALSLVAHEGSSTASPNVGSNIFFDDLQGTYTQRSLVINDSGKVAFSANLIGSGINANNKAGIWTNASGTITAAVRTGAGFQTLAKPFLNNAGKIAFAAQLTAGPDPGGIWSNVSGQVTPIVRAGTAGPGPNLPDGKQFDHTFLPVSFNEAGQVVFAGHLNELLTDPSGPADDKGVWVSNGGADSVLQRTLNPVPGTNPSDNTRFFSPNLNVAANRVNNIAVTASIFGPNIDSTNNSGIWSNTGGTWHVVARAGTAGPGPNLGANITFDRFTVPPDNFVAAFKPPVLNSSGRIAFDANITGAGVTTGNHGIWTNLNGQTTPIALVGSDTYGPGSNQTFNTIGNYSMNERGDIAFSATLSGAGVIGNGAGLWVYRDGALNKIVKTGDVIDIDPSPTKQNLQTVNNVGFIASRPEGGKQLALNDHGQVVYSLTFDSGLTGVFTSTLLQLGDFNLDGVVDKLDLPEMLKALTSLPAYRAKYNLTDADVRTIGDINGDYNALTGKGGLTNRDIQPFLNLLQAQGSGSLESVPEPATAWLSAFGVVALLANRKRNVTRRKSC